MKIRGVPADATLSNACLENKKDGIRDLSILQKPIQTSITGFKEVVKAFKDGTEEIKLLLANECDIIYECKACRNIFRSLANFISHKRTYCTANFNSLQHFHFRQNEQDIATIIEHSDVQANSKETKEHVRDLGSIIDRLMRREQTSQVITLGDLYDQASQNLTQDEVIEKKQILHLDRMVNSDVAVYQTLKKEDGDSIKKEVNEIHDMLENVQTILGPDGKVAGGSGIIGRSVALKTESLRFCCKICSRKFVTEKMLKLHIKAKHIPSTNVYPCNACSRSFLLPAGLIRHLNNDHKKPMRRIRLMREAIYRRRTRKDEVQSKGPNRELCRLQNGIRDHSAKPWTSDKNERVEISSTCSFCGKTFERRAALITHTKNCSQRGKHVVSNGHENDDDNGDKSVQSFMAMLKKEKEIQANIQKCIDEEEDRLIVAETEANSLHGNDSSVGNGDVSKDAWVEVSVIKNKRKRHLVQKVDQPINSDHNVCNSTWHVDENEPDIGNSVLSDAASLRPPEKKKKKKLVLEKTTDCTMCSKKFTNISNLRRHVAMLHYRQKTFGCELCDYKAFRKIDIINHLGVSHRIEPDVCSDLVVNIQIDSNKFNDEKIKAVAPALNKIERELLNQSNDTNRMDTVDIPDAPDVTIDPIVCHETISTGSNSKSPKDSASVTEAMEDSSNAGKLKKRGRRFKASKQSVSSEGRTISQHSSSDSLSETQPSQMNRPVRNRVKIMNKDFVYDLSNLLRKEAVVYKEQLVPIGIKNQKRESSQMTEASSREKKDIVEILPKKLSHFECIIGSATLMAQKAIDSFRACSNKPPEVPSERPIVPAKIIQMRRSTNGIQHWQASNNEEETTNGIAATIIGDKLYDALANKDRSFDASSVKIANGAADSKRDVNPQPPYVSSPDELKSNSSCLLDKNDQTICSTDEMVCQQLVVNNLPDPNNAFLVTTQTEPSPLPTNGNSKRITLLQRLMEINQSKNKLSE